jgi:SAM-dependent methyltransferase
MAWPWEVAERDHELQNPTSAEKIRLLGEYLRLGESSRVLDVACGKGGPAAILAETYGCRVRGVEVRPEFAQAAREHAVARGLESLIEVQTADASQLDVESEAWDAALCLGASFVWGTMADAALALRPFVPPRGFVAIGEPFWREWPLPEAIDPEGYVALDATIARFEQAGFAVTGVIAASEDDWDRYRSLHWRAIDEWLAEHGDDPDAEPIRARHEQRRSDYFRLERALFGWAIFVGRKV